MAVDGLASVSLKHGFRGESQQTQPRDCRLGQDSEGLQCQPARAEVRLSPQAGPGPNPQGEQRLSVYRPEDQVLILAGCAGRDWPDDTSGAQLTHSKGGTRPPPWPPSSQYQETGKHWPVP